MSKDNKEIDSQNLKKLEEMEMDSLYIDPDDISLSSNISKEIVEEKKDAIKTLNISTFLNEKNYYKMISSFEKNEIDFPQNYLLNNDDFTSIIDHLLKDKKSKDIIDLLTFKKDFIFSKNSEFIKINKTAFLNHIYSILLLNNFLKEDTFKIEHEFYFIKFYNLIIKNDDEPNSFISITNFYNDLFSYALDFDHDCFFSHLYNSDDVSHASFVEVYNKYKDTKYENIIPLEESSIHDFLIKEDQLSANENMQANKLIKLYLKNGSKIKEIVQKYVSTPPKKTNMDKKNKNESKTVILFDFDNVSKTLNTLPQDVVDKQVIELIKNNHTKKLKDNELLLKNINQLKENFPNFSSFLNFVEEECFLNELSLKTFSLPPALLVGEPGIGKTFLLNSFNNMMGYQNYFLDMGSITAGMVLSGSSEKWGNGSPGYILNTLLNSEFANPLIILDEIDKISESNNSPVIPALLTLLEKHTAKNFKDEYCSIKIDASHINWIGTANDKNIISAPLKSRFSIFDIPSPNKSERIIFAKQVFDKICKNKGLNDIIETLSSEFLEEVCQEEGSTRDISRILTLSISSAAKRRTGVEKIRLLPEDIQLNNFNDKRKYGFI